MTVEKKPTGEVTIVTTKFHLTEPVRITMTERRGLVDRLVDMVDRIKEVRGAEDVNYVTMFPRYVTRC